MAAHTPNHILNKLAAQTFDDFDHFTQAVRMAIAEDPIYYTETAHECCAEQVIAHMAAWRKSQELALFKDTK
ncbi:bacteriocin immunity protein [Pseudomonas sp. NPDC089758]|uniref:bacteriocin immunity protein n=1 Tax=Pseudomonas sp. NPDC089758 TaxID=3364473 RepID=UPI0037F3AA62